MQACPGYDKIKTVYFPAYLGNNLNISDEVKYFFIQ